MELTRSNIKEYLDNGFKNTNYCKKVRGTIELKTLKTMSFDDLDFIGILRNLYSQIQFEYNSLNTNDNWIPSDRQKAVLENLSNISNDILNNDEIKLKNNFILHLYDDFYWGIWDYFDDYNNKNEEIVKEEINLILPKLKNFLKEYEK